VKLRWTPEAADDLEAISNYLWEHRPLQAHDVLTRIAQYAKLLKRGYRKLGLAPLPYFILYRMDDYAVTLLQIRHESQDWMPVLQ
jgi:plasmid stabilization system protein ParE